MSRTDPQLRLRVPLPLRAEIERAARAARRSMNAEIVIRLEASFANENSRKEETL
ncbi:Arc family DNA-binding protein [Pseudomonas benzenivorans]|uniref:Arc family DNA-binding protein n=1 Tax=Pseudomonas benzenivorans TaxID=556533 RepID=A0ABY5HDH7_9PSED|nr:Arc family DNA-binding protein [Pseudomonas benzenivorans]UTW09320.1 Arc family DNA-binding protein [Pseudomonas benzenivorans]